MATVISMYGLDFLGLPQNFIKCMADILELDQPESWYHTDVIDKDSRCMTKYDWQGFIEHLYDNNIIVFFEGASLFYCRGEDDKTFEMVTFSDFSIAVKGMLHEDEPYGIVKYNHFSRAKDALLAQDALLMRPSHLNSVIHIKKIIKAYKEKKDIEKALSGSFNQTPEKIKRKM